MRETGERLLVRNSPRHGLAQTVDLLLCRVLEGRQGRPATPHELVDVCGFFGRDGASCHAFSLVPRDNVVAPVRFHYFGSLTHQSGTGMSL